MTGDKAGVQLGSSEGRMGQYAAQEGQVAGEAADGGLFEHGQQTLAGLLAVLAPGDQFGQHGVVEGRDGIALGHAAVHPPAFAGGRFAIQPEVAGGGQEVVIGVLGEKLYPLSILIETMRGTKQTSMYLESLGPFFVGNVIWQTPVK